MPDIPGRDTFPGTVSHSHVYRNPDSLAGKNVLVMGIGNSALGTVSLSLSPSLSLSLSLVPSLSLSLCLPSTICPQLCSPVSTVRLSQLFAVSQLTTSPYLDISLEACRTARKPVVVSAREGATVLPVSDAADRPIDRLMSSRYYNYRYCLP